MMKRYYRLFQGVLGGTLLVGAGAAGVLMADAAQLDGIQMKQVGTKVQVTLNTGVDQPYRMERGKDNSYIITMPKTKLPQAFQKTGMPLIKNKETGVTAEVNETAQGVQIKLSGVQGNDLPYEVKLKTQAAPAAALQAQSPLALFKSNPPAAGQKPAPRPQDTPPRRSMVRRSPQVQPVRTAVTPPYYRPRYTAVAPVRSKPKPVVMTTRPRRRAVIAARPKPKPVLVATKSQPIVMMAKPASKTSQAPPVEEVIVMPVAPKTAEKPGVENAEAGAIQKESPVVIPSETELVSLEEPAGTTKVANKELLEGVNFLNQLKTDQQAEEKSQATQTAKTQASERTQHLPFTQVPLTRSMVRFVLVSLVLLGGLLLLAVGGALWMKRRLGVKTVEEELPPEAMISDIEFFEPLPPTQAPPLETFEAYLREEDTVREQQQASPPVAPVTQSTVSRRAKPVTVVSTDTLLKTPVTSVSDAVKVGLARKRDNPYLSAPFQNQSKDKWTTTGPKANPMPSGFHHQMPFNR